MLHLHLRLFVAKTQDSPTVSLLALAPWATRQHLGLPPHCGRDVPEANGKHTRRRSRRRLRFLAQRHVARVNGS